VGTIYVGHYGNSVHMWTGAGGIYVTYADLGTISNRTLFTLPDTWAPPALMEIELATQAPGTGGTGLRLVVRTDGDVVLGEDVIE
jgi:hypothetical protein